MRLWLGKGLLGEKSGFDDKITQALVGKAVHAHACHGAVSFSHCCHSHTCRTFFAPMSHRTAGIRTFGIRTLVSFALLTLSHCWHSHCWLRTGVVRTLRYIKETFGLFVNFEFLTEMGSWDTDQSIPVGLRKILQRKVVENGVRKKRPRTGISRGKDRDAVCAFKFAPSRHAFDLHTFFRLTRALCRSRVVEGSRCGTLLIFCQSVVLVCPLLLHEEQEARIKGFAVARFRKRPEINPSSTLCMAMWSLRGPACARLCSRSGKLACMFSPRTNASSSVQPSLFS